MNGTVFNITRFCNDDGPGIRTTVFLKGCCLRCIWCHNPESQAFKPEWMKNKEEGKPPERLVGYEISAQEVMETVYRDKVYYELSGGGMTLSGGEPLCQPDFAEELLRKAKEEKIHTALETSGYSGRETFEKVLKWCDLVLFDIKETCEEKHLQYTGVSLKPILENLQLVNSLRIPVILRLPVIPGLNDRTEHFKAVRKLAEKLSSCIRVQIMPYHKLGEYKYSRLGRNYACAGTKEPSKETVKYWYSLLQ